MTASSAPPALDVRQHLVGLLRAALASVAPSQGLAEIVLERPKQASHGDFASNLALQLARELKTNPRQVAERLVRELPPSPHVTKAEVAGAGFINFTLAPAARTAVVAAVLAAGGDFGRGPARNGRMARRLQVEFVSANPTGPLHVGHGRGAAYGASLASLLAFAGYEVTREYYVNDAGRQMDILAVSAGCVTWRCSTSRCPSRPTPTRAATCTRWRNRSSRPTATATCIRPKPCWPACPKLTTTRPASTP